MDNNGKETFSRGCDHNRNYNYENDKCEKCEAWGAESHTCVCREDECNGVGKHAVASLIHIVMALVAVQYMCSKSI